MSEFDKLLGELNKEKVMCFSVAALENIPEDIWKEYFNNNNGAVVEEGLDRDEHRWYCTGITVVEIFGRYLGIRHICNLHSEQMMESDCDFYCEFFEMNEVQKTTYVKKSLNV